MARIFPLNPRRRISGSPLGYSSSLRRGRSGDIAGSRPYRPGDDRRHIDRHASARISAVKGSDEFIVREYYAEESPLVCLVIDRHRSMQLYPQSFPWLSKPDTVAAAASLVAASTIAARSALCYADRDPDGSLFWQRPRAFASLEPVTNSWLSRAHSAAKQGLLLEELAPQREHLPPGSFVFYLSDFLFDIDEEAVRTAAACEWDLVPVIVQDATWEQSFPLEAAAMSLPLTDPDGGELLIRLSRREAARTRAANEERLRNLIDMFTSFDYTPVLLETSDPDEILRRFLDWSTSNGRRPH